LPYRIGASIHVSAYGCTVSPFFAARLSQGDGFRQLYHALAAPLATIEFTEADGLCELGLEPNARAATDPRVYRFIAEMQIGIQYR